MRRLRSALGAAACIAAACIALPAQAFGARDMVLGRMVPARSDAPAVAATTSVRSQFVLHCAGCHGVDGAGSKIGNVPDMRRLGDFLRVPGGRDFVISVPGVMGSGLNDAQVAEVTNWVLATLARGSAPPDTPPFSADEVARARAAPLTDVAAVRQGLIDKARSLGVPLD